MAQSSLSLLVRLVSSTLLPLLTVTCTERSPLATGDTADSTPVASARVAPAPSLVCDAGNGGITLPPGFCAIVVADSVGLARHITV